MDGDDGSARVKEQDAGIPEHVDPDADSPTLFSGASGLLESVPEADVGAFLGSRLRMISSTRCLRWWEAVDDGSWRDVFRGR